MMQRRTRPVLARLALCAAVLLPGLAPTFAPTLARAAELRVLTAGAYRAVLADLAPDAARDLGTVLSIRNETAGAVADAIRGGADADLVVLPPAAAGALGTLLGPTRPLARVGIGIAVPAGAPAPPVATAEEVRAALLGARAPAWIDPASGGSSGIYMDALVRRWGIAETVLPRAVLVPGGLVADALRDGRADLAFQQMSELHGPGIAVLGPLPQAVQSYTTYAGAVPARSPRQDEAAALLAWLASPNAAAALAAHGMEAP